MENSQGTAQHPPVVTQRRIELRHASIQADKDALRRTGQFTDGSIGAVEMKWNQVRRVAAFRRDVQSSPVVCVAITDPNNVMVLDESMDGWQSLTEFLPTSTADAPNLSEWRGRIAADSPDSYWTVLFLAGQ